MPEKALTLRTTSQSKLRAKWAEVMQQIEVFLKFFLIIELNECIYCSVGNSNLYNIIFMSEMNSMEWCWNYYYDFFFFVNLLI